MAGLSGDDAEDLLAARLVHKETEKLFVLVSEHAPKTATRLMIDKTQNLVEPVSAVALTAVLSAPARFTGWKVTIVCSGGNISPVQLAGLWPREPA